MIFVVRTGATAIRVADALEIEEAGWFALDALPADISPASLRRIKEYRRGEIGLVEGRRVRADTCFVSDVHQGG